MITMVFSIFFIGLKSESFAGASGIIGPETDRASYILVSVFDLRDRESFVQVTNTSSSAVTTHVQIFAVNDDCRENNFFDTYTGNDTHVYNMRDILTNDGNPSGVVLNDGEYGMVVVTAFANGTIDIDLQDLIGNFRILDDLGYEYRTNSAGSSRTQNDFVRSSTFTANFNTLGGVTLSDIFNIVLSNAGTNSAEVTADPLETFAVFNLDIINLNEVPASCPNFIVACIDQDSPLYEELLEVAALAGGASVASFEYGINDAIPSSKGAPTACPSNVVSDGFTRSTFIGGNFVGVIGYAASFVGLNNGNGRGSMDQLWGENIFIF